MTRRFALTVWPSQPRGLAPTTARDRGAKSGLIEPGDAEAGLRAAAAIGDDRLQRMSSGRVQPESFTHGSSAQRVEWLRRGLDSGDPGACRTFDGSF